MEKITARHLQVLLALSRYAKTDEPADYDAIAEGIGCQPVTVKIYVCHLKRAGYIKNIGAYHSLRFRMVERKAVAA